MMKALGSFDGYDGYCNNVDTARAAIPSNLDEGVIILSDVNRGRAPGRTAFERWGVVAPTQDKLRHVALDVATVVIARHGDDNCAIKRHPDKRSL